MRLRELYRLLAAQGGVLERPYLECVSEGERRGKAPSVRAHSSDALLLLPGEVHWTEKGEEASVLDLCSRGSVDFNISIADIRKPGSERLPFFRSRALKLSLLVVERRSLRWMELLWRCIQEMLGLELVGVMGREEMEARECSSSDSQRPRTFLFDLWYDKKNCNFTGYKGLPW